MKKIIGIVFLLGLTSSCGDKHNTGDISKEILSISQNKSVIEENSLSGDMISLKEKKQLNLDPQIAHIPVLDFKFSENVKIKIEWGECNGNKTWFDIIDSRSRKGRVDFKYNYGNILAIRESYRQVAKLAKHEKQRWGELNGDHFDIFSYPNIESSFIQAHLLKLKTNLNNANICIKNHEIEVDNLINLERNPIYKNIKNLKINFYYYSYSKNNYQKIEGDILYENTEKIIDDNIQKIKFFFPNTSLELIEDNLLERGEFIIAQIEDFEIVGIPDNERPIDKKWIDDEVINGHMTTMEAKFLKENTPNFENLTYRRLMDAVKKKSTHLIIDEPDNTKSYWIANNSHGRKINDLLKVVHGNNVEINNNKITSIGYVKNNLGEFEYLSELKTEDGRGEWFGFSRPLNTHFLDYKFKANDHILLKYFTGKELSHIPAQKITTNRLNISGGKEFEVYDIGKVEPNSEVNIQISPIQQIGGWEIYYQQKNIWQSPKVASHRCGYEIILMRPKVWPLIFDKKMLGEINNLYLIVNGVEHKITELIAKNLIIIKWVDNDKNIHLKINNLKNISEAQDLKPTQIKLKIITHQKSSFTGLRPTDPWVDNSLHNWNCFRDLSSIATNNGWPMSRDTYNFDLLWQKHLQWGARPQVQTSGRINWSDEFTISVSTIITNFYN